MTGTSKEYAAAIFHLALETGSQDELAEGFALVSEVLEKSPELIPFLDNPGISKESRLSVLRGALGDSVPEYLLSMLSILCEKRQTELFFACAEEFELLYRESRRWCRTVVTSAVPLCEEEKQALYEKLQKKEPLRLEMEYIVDPSILGGVIVEMDGVVLDGSLRRRLKTMKEVISE